MKFKEMETTKADAEVIAQLLRAAGMHKAKVWLEDESVIVRWYGSISEHDHIDDVMYNAGYALAATITYGDSDWWKLCDLGHRFVKVEVIETN